MCKFEYTKRYEKWSKVFDFIHFVYTAFLLLGVIGIVTKAIDQNIMSVIMCWVIGFMAITEGIFDIYKFKAISVPNIEFTLNYGEIKTDDPLQKHVVAQAVELATSWASFALQREKRKIMCYIIPELSFGVMMFLLLIF